jgi:hypothetical protein
MALWKSRRAAGAQVTRLVAPKVAFPSQQPTVLTAQPGASAARQRRDGFSTIGSPAQHPIITQDNAASGPVSNRKRPDIKTVTMVF